MGMTPRGCACLAVVALLALSACAGARPSRGEEPALRFVQPHEGDGRAAAEARVRRDAYGRRIHFREQRLDKHGVMRDVVPRATDDVRDERGADCDDHRYCPDSDGDGGR